MANKSHLACQPLSWQQIQSGALEKDFEDRWREGTVLRWGREQVEGQIHAAGQDSS